MRWSFNFSYKRHDGHGFACVLIYLIEQILRYCFYKLVPFTTHPPSISFYFLLLVKISYEYTNQYSVSTVEKLARLKQAKEEAEKDIAEYRAHLEHEFQKKVSAVSLLLTTALEF